jgi:hypothetical protein
MDMATKKKAVAKKKAAPAAAKEHLWRVNLRGYKEYPQLSIVAPGETKEEAVSYAKSLVAAAIEKAGETETEKVPAVASAKKLDDSWYRVFGDDRSMYMLVQRIIVRDGAKKGYGSRDDDSYKNEVGVIACEFHSATLGSGEHDACSVFLSVDKKGMYSNFVDDHRYQSPPKSTLAMVFHGFWGEIESEMRKALKAAGKRI